VPCPNIVFPTRGSEMAGIGVLPVRPARLGIGPRFGQFQPQEPPAPPHRLLVDRPALADQQRPDPPVAEPRMRAGQFLDPPGQRRPDVALDGRVPEAGGRRSWLFFKASWSMRRSSASSATKVLR